ncbi:MAG: sensor histidine kinase [Candidatus Kapaibacteriota bacterium]
MFANNINICNLNVHETFDFGLIIFNELGIILANKVGASCFGLNEEEIIGLSFPEIFDKNYPKLSNEFAVALEKLKGGELSHFYLKNIDCNFNSEDEIIFKITKLQNNDIDYYVVQTERIHKNGVNERYFLSIHKISSEEDLLIANERLNSILVKNQEDLEKIKKLEKQITILKQDINKLTQLYDENQMKILAYEQQIADLIKQAEDAQIVNNIQLQEENRKTVKMKKEYEDLIKIQSSIINNIGAELRTPLNGIFGFLQLLQIELNDNPKSKETLKLILNSAEKMRNILDTLMLLSELESGTKDVIIQEINLKYFFEFLIETFSIYVPDSKRIKFEYILKNDNLSVKADNNLLFLVCSQILENSFKFTKKGFVRIEAEEFSTKEEKFVLIKIKDSGIGIPKEKLISIFEPFTQKRELTTEHFTGIGIGLPISKKIVELMHGTIGVQSTVNQGTTIIIQLPKA